MDEYELLRTQVYIFGITKNAQNKETLYTHNKETIIMNYVLN